MIILHADDREHHSRQLKTHYNMHTRLQKFNEVNPSKLTLPRFTAFGVWTPPQTPRTDCGKELVQQHLKWHTYYITSVLRQVQLTRLAWERDIREHNGCSNQIQTDICARKGAHPPKLDVAHRGHVLQSDMRQSSPS